MPDYARLAATATRLIASAGLPAVLEQRRNGDYNAATGEVESTPRKSNCKAVRLQYRLSDVDGSLIQQGDAKFLVSPDAPQPVAGDRLLYSGQYWAVVACETVQPADVVLYHELQCRK